MERRETTPSTGVRILSGTPALLESRDAWNALWERSGVARPTARAEFIDLWARHFATADSLRAVVVEADGVFLAALPLIETRWPWRFRSGENLHDHWAAAGEWLLDPSAPPEAVVRALGAIRSFRWPWLRLRAIPLSAPVNELVGNGCRQLGRSTFVHRTHDVGVVELGGDYEAFMAARSKNHRSHMRKAARRAEREGGVTLRIVRGGEREEIAAEVRRGFEVERRSWKGRAGSAVLDVPVLVEYFIEQAVLLAASDALHLVFLEHRGQPIAFEFGLLARGTYFTPKVGYDEQFSPLSPGQLLRAMLFERFCGEPIPPRVDFDGPLADATSKWCTSTIPYGTRIVALDRVRGIPFLGTYRAAHRWKSARGR